MSVRKHASDATHFLGTILMYGGGAGLFIMAAVGTISVDIVLLAFASKQRNDFLTGYILGSMLYRNNSNPMLLMVISPLITALAIVLSVALGVSGVGFALAAGWAVSAALYTIGCGLIKLADKLATPVEGTAAVPTVQQTQHFGFFKSNTNNRPFDDAPVVSSAYQAA